MSESEFENEKGSRTISSKFYFENVEKVYLGTELPIPNTLPASRGFVGREDKLAELRDAFKQGCRCFVFYGPGGGGKSSLAVRFGNEVAVDFDAKVFVRMLGMSSEPHSWRAAMFDILRQFKSNISPRAKDNELRSQFLSVLQKQQTLVVLDDVWGRESFEPLLEADALFVITSRKMVKLAGGKTTRIAKLSETDAVDLLATIAGMARLEGQGKKLANLAGYLPMALKPIASILAEDELETASRLVTAYENKLNTLLDERVPDYGNRTIRASLELSYEKLDSEMAERWRVLSVFPSDFDEAAMAAVLSLPTDSVYATHKYLRQHSLLEMDTQLSRFHLHDLSRVFCSEKLTGDECFKVKFLFSEHYAQLLVQADAEMFPDAGESSYSGRLNLLDREWNNILAGQRWAADPTNADVSVKELCVGYSSHGSQLLRLRLTPRNDIIWLTAGLNAAMELGLKRSQAQILNSLGLAYKNLGQNKEAAEYYQKAFQIFTEMGDLPGVARTLNNMGTANNALGSYEEAETLLRKSLSISQELGDHLMQGHALQNLGLAYSNRGNYRKAIEYFQNALEMKRQSGDQLGISISLNSLGTAYKQIGQNKKAIDSFNASRKIAKELRNKIGESSSLNSLGLMHTIKGDYISAIRFHERALLLAREMTHELMESNILNNLGMAYGYLGENQKAIDQIQAALEIKTRLGHKQGIVNAINNLGKNQKILGNVKEAIRLHRDALERSREFGYGLGESNSLSLLGAAYSDASDFDLAIEFQKEALEVARAIGNSLMEGYCLTNLGEYYVKLNEYSLAVEHLSSASLLGRTKGEKLVEGTSNGYLGIAFYHLRDRKMARRKLESAVKLLKKIKAPQSRDFQKFLDDNFGGQSE